MLKGNLTSCTLSYTIVTAIAIMSTFSPSSDSEHFSFEGFSDVEQDLPVKDYLEGIIYHVNHLNSNNFTITFLTTGFFHQFLEQIKKEFTFDSSQSKFTITTHADGLKCILNFNCAASIIEVKGLGSMKWKDKNFIRMATNLFLEPPTSEESLNSTCLSDIGDSNESCSHINQELSDERADPLSRVPVVNSTPAMTPTEGPTGDHRQPSTCMCNTDQLLTVIQTLQKQVGKMQKQIDKLINEKVKLAAQREKPLTISRHSQTIGPTTMSLSKSVQTPEVLPMQFSNSDTDSVSCNTSKAPYKPIIQSKHTTLPSISKDNILLIGSSILHGINNRGLRHCVRKHAISGA